jgi:DNA-binding winged helix-turn-helix (wHTH) protein
MVSTLVEGLSAVIEKRCNFGVILVSAENSMKLSTHVDFPPFRLDTANEQLWRMTAQGAEALRLRPKTFAVLCYLIEHEKQLVTKNQFLDTLWPGTVVTDSALKSCVRELRRVLGDTLKTPRFIETVHRRGYRFIAPLSTASPVSGFRFQVSGSQVGGTSQQGGT